MSEKFCKDCKHYRKSLMGSIFSDCASPKQGLDLTNGELNTHRTYSRRISGCGKMAVWFESKEESWFSKKLSSLLMKLKKKVT